MPAGGFPLTAAWAHRDARSGFEVVWFAQADGGHRLSGCTAALEGGKSWAVDYEIRVDPERRTRYARVTGRSSAGSRTVILEADGQGHWWVDGDPAPRLDGCFDVDLESSAMTNALPVRRLALAVGDRAAAPAAHVRAPDLGVERLEQEYARVADEGSRQCYDYAAAAFGFACRLVHDEAGLVLDYPGIAIRAG